MVEALCIHVKGIVQGVGFRPFIYRLARKYLISGWVLNAADGVFIHAEGEAQHLDEFIIEISENPPAASRVEEIDMKEVPLESFNSFEIRFSDAAEVEKTTLISPDLATCKDCTQELFDPTNRRYRYPFINCTNCGPRFTIIDALPYDREHTSMRTFPMCNSCQHEYEDPLDRRFHAQPDACFTCGPYLSWRLAHSDEASICWGRNREASDELLSRAIAFLRAGKIVAIKGLGGFHLACDAHNEEALATLRARKRRQGQAFAVMMRDVEQVRKFCEVNRTEEELLTGMQRPIVLLKKRYGVDFAQGLADGLAELGVMLPYTPLQHLLSHDFDGMLVMTSANIHDEPIVIDDDEAYRVLGDVADAFLGHNRSITARYDDSVVRVLAIRSAVSSTNEGAGVCGAVRPCGAPEVGSAILSPSENKVDGTQSSIQFIRRARGYAPLPLLLPKTLLKDEHPSLLAAGPEQKNTFCLTRGQEAFVSQHIGDMENAETFDGWLEAKQHYERLFEIRPTLISCDLHPEYLSSKWAHEQGKTGNSKQILKQDDGYTQDRSLQCAQIKKKPLVEVQHHHAHLVSVMAENGLEAPVVGIAFDGSGYGIDGALWGGEVLLCNFETFERFANFVYIPMPGGAAAIKHPRRMAYGALWAFDLLDHPAAQKLIADLGSTAALCEQMIDQGLNTPLTSSVGRLFDAASALLGVCTEPRYEGEGAILLEAALPRAWMQGGVALDDDLVARNNSAQQDPYGVAVPKKIEEFKKSTPECPCFIEEDSASVAKEVYSIEITKNTATATSTAKDTSVVLLDTAPVFKAMLDDMLAGEPIAVIAMKFHNAFVQAIVDVCRLVQMTYGITTVALSGGVFMNRYLTERLFTILPDSGFVVAVNRELPPNDGCISYGQAVVALAANK